ncbi:MAG: hypothetical protein AAF628_37585 [Planctomycetota bacterium]
MQRRALGRTLAVSIAVFAGVGCEPAPPPRPEPWPPVVGQQFPEMTLIDHRGEPMPLSSLRGKVVLIDVIGMPCAGCIAFAGGDVHGPFAGVEPQPGLPSLEDLFADYAGGASLTDPDLAVVQMLFFAPKMGLPTVAEAKQWYEHFDLAAKPNHFVVIGPPGVPHVEAHPLIPGFWLLDRDFEVVVDATGSRQGHLYDELLPRAGELLRAAPASPR